MTRSAVSTVLENVGVGIVVWMALGAMGLVFPSVPLDPPTGDAVVCIVLGRADSEMLRVTTRRVVARMQDVEPLWYAPFEDFVSEPMPLASMLGEFKVTISFAVDFLARQSPASTAKILLVLQEELCDERLSFLPDIAISIKEHSCRKPIDCHSQLPVDC